MKNSISLNSFILKRIIKFNPTILFYMIGTIITSGMTPYISMVIMKAIIQMWGKNIEVNAALAQVALLIFFAGIIYSSKAFFGNMLLPYLNDYRQSEKRILYKNIMRSDFQEIETSEYWNAFQKAQLSVRRNYAGNEGVLHNWVDMGASCIPFVFAMVAIKEFDLIILGIIISFAFIGNLVMGKAEHAMTEQEINLYPLRYKTERFFKIMSSLPSPKEMRVGNAFGLLSRKFDGMTNDLIYEEKNIYDHNFRAKVFLGLLVAMQDIIIYAVLINRYKANQFDIAEWTLLIAAMSMVTLELTKVSSILTQIKSNCAMVAEFKNFLENGKKENNHKNDPAREMKYDHNEIPLICFEKVCFDYKDFHALKDIDLVVNKGEKVAIVGLNGAGKSTLIKLLAGLYHPDHGDIYFDGENTKTINSEKIFEKCSCLFQDVNIYPYSVLANVSFCSEKESDMEKINRLFQHISDNPFVDELPQKEHTILSKEIDNNGVDLSGGQKQIISLVRAFYKESDLLIFDEPTAALDPIAEKRIFTKISEIAKDKTVIFVSHRIISTTFCDKIILLKDGEITEKGTHKELIEKKGMYYELFSLQMEKDLKGKLENAYEK